MRLIRLKIKNITSLKSEHVIDFQSIADESSIFAITGDTGSGKSTVLNCIGLALYGEIYKKNVNQLDVVTLGEKEGQIELIFQSKNKYYLADWRAKVLKQDGKPYSTPQSPQRIIYELDQPDFSASKTATNLSASEILNLDFEQFCKCVILNQGEFARFLNSSFTERKAILEKLYPGEIFENISKELKSEQDHFQKQKFEIEIELNSLKSDAIDSESLKGERNALQKRLTSKEEWYKKIEILEREFNSLISLHDRNSENRDRSNIIIKELTHLTTEHNKLLITSQSISEQYQSIHQKQEKELPRLQELLKVEEGLHQIKIKLKETQDRIQSINKSLEAHELRLKNNSDKKKLINDQSNEIKKAINTDILLLKKAKEDLNVFFEIYSELEVITKEIDGKESYLKQIEEMGKTQAKTIKELEIRLNSIPETLDKQIDELSKERKEIQQKTEENQKINIQRVEIEKNLLQAKKEFEDLTNKINELHTSLEQVIQELIPIKTTLQLEELNLAIETCLKHPLAKEKEECPVCHSELKNTTLLKLISEIQKLDVGHLKQKREQLERKQIQLQEELKLLLLRKNDSQETIQGKTKTLETLKGHNITLTLEDIDEKLAILQKFSWEKNQLIENKDKTSIELSRSRDQYTEIKSQITQLKTNLESKNQTLLRLQSKYPELILEFNKELINKLKLELKQLAVFEQVELELAHLEKELSNNQEQIELNRNDLKKETLFLRSIENEMTSLSDILTKELNGASAKDIIHQLQSDIKLITEKKLLQDKSLGQSENALKQLQGRLYSAQELKKDYEIEFDKTKHNLHLEATTDSTDAGNELGQLLNLLTHFELDLNSPRELFSPLIDLILSQKNEIKESTNSMRMEVASINTKLSEWEKKQDKVSLLESKNHEIKKRLDRINHLYEVLGKDELRTFLLSLVEENLIEHTNEELKQLCQGRYEIIHQSKRMKLTPEFYILDKFKDGAQRKVSTLSGGETFMVSLAMALALAEMTRGTAEIDSLFIDEGFGTLDQESLDDVLDMLGQIQTRGLMIGIISHIKALTNSIPVNLVLKKMNDGTSNLLIQHN
ncbi:MAG: AAA family ATPase [Bacteriovoracaceae bacterium]